MSARISLTMIIKNEAATLGRCLASVCDLVDEIIVVDTGSSDNTKENVTDPLGDVSTYTYDADGRRTSYIDPENDTTRS